MSVHYFECLVAFLYRKSCAVFLFVLRTAVTSNYGVNFIYPRQHLDLHRQTLQYGRILLPSLDLKTFPLNVFGSRVCTCHSFHSKFVHISNTYYTFKLSFLTLIICQGRKETCIVNKFIVFFS